MLIDDVLAKGPLWAGERESLQQAMVIQANNVAEYFWTGNEQEEWLLDRDFPNVAPPFDNLWIEYLVPRESHSKGKRIEQSGRIRSGVWIRSKEVNQTDHRWVSLGCLFEEKERVMPDWLRVEAQWLVRADGSCFLPKGALELSLRGTQSVEGPELTDYAVQNSCRTLFVPFLALSFMHCKNIDLIRGPAHPDQLQRSRVKKGKLPLIRWHTLVIEPVKKIVAEANGGKPTLTPKALHICRGHFKQFTEKGLFGKKFGTFWWSDHARGHVEAGIVGKDYDVRAPQRPEEK